MTSGWPKPAETTVPMYVVLCVRNIVVVYPYCAACWDNAFETRCFRETSKEGAKIKRTLSDLTRMELRVDLLLALIIPLT